MLTSASRGSKVLTEQSLESEPTSTQRLNTIRSMHTGQLDTRGMRLSHEHLTPAADIYSLAKTTYTLLAGESPRRFAQHALTELPEHLRGEPWARAVLRVLEKATQNRPEARYQSVEEFWDEIADASLPPTLPLKMVAPELHLVRRKPSEDLSVEPEEEFTEAAPPRPHFDDTGASVIRGRHAKETAYRGAHQWRPAGNCAHGRRYGRASAVLKGVDHRSSRCCLRAGSVAL